MGVAAAAADALASECCSPLAAAAVARDAHFPFVACLLACYYAAVMPCRLGGLRLHVSGLVVRSGDGSHTAAEEVGPSVS